ncbi:MAG: molybdate ABC transporter substrate-binding protein [Clostridiales Family XIII bacterium]|jgi:molybdate transport system substrate-binding protein|nr:molybdate ABC transporter substrate-binding protein [Clostridiales Family XIII bacterium]
MLKLKKNKLMPILIIALALMMAMFGACGDSSSSASSASSDGATSSETAEPDEPEVPAITGNVAIAAAASLEKTFTEKLIPAFTAANPEVTFDGSTYDSSGKLQEQIEGGLEPAIFFSAATKQMTALVEGGFIDAASVTNLLENQLALITSVSSDTTVTGFEDITNAKSIAIGDPASVPAGQYAQEALTSLGSWDKVSASASLGTNVTEVLNQVAEGSAEVGIVYATDAAGLADKVKVLAIAPDGSLEKPVIYPVAALIKISDADQEAVAAFIDFLKGSEAKAIFEAAGFKVL